VSILDKPKFNVLEENESAMLIEFRGFSRELVNALRRTMIAEVPVLAIDEVLFVENSSSLYNEYIAHRLGLVPLKTPRDPDFLAKMSLDLQEGVVSSFRADLQLRAVCPEQAGGPITVNSSDLKGVGESPVEPADPNIPLFKLNRGQSVELQAFVTYGIGKQHAKFSPVSPVSFTFKPVIHFDKTKDINCEEHVNVCPTNCLIYEKGELRFTDPWKCILCKACEKDCKTGAVKIGWDESVVRMTIETTGALPPRVILKTAALILKQKLDHLEELVKGVQPVIGGEKP